MLLLLFTLGKARYGIDCAPVVEIVPAVYLQEITQAPDFVAGFFQYRGAIVPVIDLRQLIAQERCSTRLSTRIIVVNYKTAAGLERLIGLMAEKVTETVKISPEQFKPTGVTLAAAPYLGSVAVNNNEMIQCLQLNRILSPSVQDTLFRQ
jgi:chemotaxis-related protein WspB